MEDLGHWLSILLALLGLVGLAAGVAAFFRSNYVKSTISTLEASNRAQAERITILEAQAKEDKGKIGALEAAVLMLQNEKAQLIAVLQGRAEVATLSEQLASLERSVISHHEEVMHDRHEFFSAWQHQIERQEAMIGALTGIVGGGERDM